MLNNYVLFSAITAIISAIIIALPLTKPPPKSPTNELQDWVVVATGGTLQRLEDLRTLNKELRGSLTFHRKCTRFSLAVLTLSVVLGLVGAAVG